MLTNEGINNIGTCRYFLMPDGLEFIHEMAAKRQGPYGLTDKTYDYDAGRITPNARNFLSTWIRWFWTEEYTERHIEFIAKAIRKVMARNLK